MTNAIRSAVGFIPEWTLGDRLRKARESTGLGIVEFAEKVGISRVTVNNAEGNKKRPQQATLKMWALATGVNYEWLLTGETPAPSDDGTGVEYRAPSQIRTDDLFFKRQQKAQRLGTVSPLYGTIRRATAA